MNIYNVLIFKQIPPPENGEGYHTPIFRNIFIISSYVTSTNIDIYSQKCKKRAMFLHIALN